MTSTRLTTLVWRLERDGAPWYTTRGVRRWVANEGPGSVDRWGMRLPWLAALLVGLLAAAGPALPYLLPDRQPLWLAFAVVLSFGLGAFLAYDHFSRLREVANELK